MSGYGLGRQPWLPTARVQRVELANSRRGFGKASIHGDRYAMIAEPVDPSRPLTARRLTPEQVGAAPQAIAVDVASEDLPALAKREGYSAKALQRLERQSLEAKRGIANYLAALMEGCRGDIVRYRRVLRDRLDYTSGHYIPHPIRLEDEWAVIFLAPGPEGSGCDTVEPVRVKTGVCELMTCAEAWARKPNESQLDYIAMCLLAAAHGVCVDDLDADLPPELARRLRNYAAHFDAEAERLSAVLGLSPEAYQAFAGPTAGTPKAWAADVE